MQHTPDRRDENSDQTHKLYPKPVAQQGALQTGVTHPVMFDPKGKPQGQQLCQRQGQEQQEHRLREFHRIAERHNANCCQHHDLKAQHPMACPPHDDQAAAHENANQGVQVFRRLSAGATRFDDQVKKARPSHSATQRTTPAPE